MSFAEVEKVGALLRELRCEWYVCGGWAIDLFLARVTREHKDVDICVARRDQAEARDYLLRHGWCLEKAAGGELTPWRECETLAPAVHTVWCRRDGHDPSFFELLFDEIDDERFSFRRDPTVTLARGRISFKSPSGLAVLAPEIVLLYKASRPEEYAADFRNAAVSLDGEARAWLRAALEKVYARHLWAEELRLITADSDAF
ncbi:MAG: amino acid transporter [Acidobacteriota bacterium]|nr:amino acid transporter [Acidobacteriota bacterium]